MYYAGITSQLFESDHCVIFLKLWVMRRFKTKTKPRLSILNLDHQRLSNPEIRKNLCEEVMRNINCNSDFSYLDVSNTFVKATSTILPRRCKAQPGWFRAKESHPLPLIEARNDAMRNVFKRRTRQSAARLKQARAVLEAKKMDQVSMCIDEHKKWKQNRLEMQ